MLSDNSCVKVPNRGLGCLHKLELIFGVVFTVFLSMTVYMIFLLDFILFFSRRWVVVDLMDKVTKHGTTGAEQAEQLKTRPGDLTLETISELPY